MFGFLKDKLKGVLGKFSQKVEEEAPEVKVPAEEVPKKKEVKAEKKKEQKKTPKVETPKAEKVEPKIESPVIEQKIEPVQQPVEEKLVPNEEKKWFFTKLKETFVKEEKKVIVTEQIEEKKGFFQKISETITTKKISAEKFEELFWDLELALLENNVAVEVIEKIKTDLKTELVDKPLPRGQIEERIALSLHKSIEDLFSVPNIDILAKVKSKKPYVICFVGINGSGKTTSIAKVAHYLQTRGLSVVLAAADTFRAAAIDQLQLHADNLGLKLIKHDYGSDPAAVAFDAIKHAEAKKADVVLIDTAGRLHSNVNLMDEMKKIIRVAKPDLKLFIGESITGNDCVEQAKKFDEAVGIDGIILSKADIDEKGGAAISVSYVTKKPIVFLGVGQEYDDLQPFDKEKLLASIGL